MEPGITVVALCVIVALTHKFWAKVRERREGEGGPVTESASQSFALTESQGEWDRVQRELGELPPIEECDEILPPEPGEAESEQEVEPIDDPPKADVPFERRPVRGWLKLFEVLQVIDVVFHALYMALLLALLGVAVWQTVVSGGRLSMVFLGWCLVGIAGFVMQLLVVVWFKRRQMRFRTMYSALIAVSLLSWCASALYQPPASMMSAIGLMLRAAWISYLNQSPQVETMFAPPPYRMR